MRFSSALFALALAVPSLVVPDPCIAGQVGTEGQSLDTIPLDTIGVEAIPGDRIVLDQEVQAELAALLGRIPGLERVDVRLEAGVAFLSGSVLSMDDRERAEGLVNSAPGVVYVDNRIREETSLQTRLRPMWDRTLEKVAYGVAYAPLLLMAAALVVLFFLLGGVVSRWEGLFRRASTNPFLQDLLGQITGMLVGLVGVLLALELLDATALVGAVLGAAGVIGVAVGFAFRNIAENYLAGILLSLRQPFAPNDQILVEGQEGKVVRLSSRETILMTLDGNHVRIPNATIFNSIVLNYTRNPLRRFRFDISVGQDQDLLRAQELGLEALRRLDGVLQDPRPRAETVEIGDSWILLRFFGWADQKKASFEKVRSEAIRLVFETLDRGGVRMPAPEYGLRFLSQSALPTEASSDGLIPEGEVDAPAPPPNEIPDLSPETDLDSQIARDREGAGQPDLLGPKNTD